MTRVREGCHWFEAVQKDPPGSMMMLATPGCATSWLALWPSCSAEVTIAVLLNQPICIEFLSKSAMVLVKLVIWCLNQVKIDF